MNTATPRTVESPRNAPPPYNPDRIDRYFYPDEMDEAFRRFTFHIDFNAHDETHAQLLAERYARGINQMRQEVDAYSAKISNSIDWPNARMVTCLAEGPDPSDVCTELAGHRCPHNGPGATGTWPGAQPELAELPPK